MTNSFQSHKNCKPLKKNPGIDPPETKNRPCGINNSAIYKL